MSKKKRVMRQSTVSQQLARLRLEGLVSARRDGKTIHYSIADDKVRAVIGVLYKTFCGAPSRPRSGASPSFTIAALCCHVLVGLSCGAEDRSIFSGRPSSLSHT